MTDRSASGESPNVLLATVDSLRADYSFGPKAPASLETLPSLAADGTVFETAFANAPYTKASFLSIFGGCHPWAFDGPGGGYGPDRPHLAELFADAGYDTAGFTTNTYLSPVYGYDRGFDHYTTRDGGSDTGRVDRTYGRLVERALQLPGVSDAIHRTYTAAGKHLGVQLGSRLYAPAEELVDRVVEWTRGRDRPAFVWVHFMDVHNPYYPQAGTVSETVDRRRAVKLFHRVNERRGDASQTALATLERLYRGELTHLDDRLGSLLARLDEEWVVAVASDHGEAFGENGRVFHPGDAVDDPTTHVPLVVVGSGIDDRTVTTPVSNADIAPTLAAAAGLDPPAGTTGTDLRQLPDDGDRLVFTESFTPETGTVAVTDGTVRLVRDRETGTEELRHRNGEPVGAGGPPAGAASVSRLRQALDDHVRSVGEARREQTAVPEDVRLRLRKLGYDE